MAVAAAQAQPVRSATHAPVAAGQPFTTSGELLAAGTRSLEKGDAGRAAALLSAALVRRPNHVETAIKLSEAYERTGRGEEALRLIESVFAQQRSDVALRIRLAVLRGTYGEFDDAVELLTPLREDARAACALARLYRRANMFVQAWEAAEAGLKHAPRSLDLWLEYVDATLAADRAGLALERVEGAARKVGWAPALHLRAAQARAALGEVLGRTLVRQAPEGRAGQFRGDYLLLESHARGGFLCCPRESAMYQVRRALDGGCDEPEAHLLHARLWLLAGRPAIARAILAAREAALLEGAGASALQTFADVALAAGEVDEFLRYKRLESRGCPEGEVRIMSAAYASAAEHYSLCGDAVLHAEMLRQAVLIAPGETDLRLRLADADWELGRAAQASEHYRTVLSQAPEHPQRGRMLERIGCVAP